MLENRRDDIREIAVDLNNFYGSTQHILVNFLDIQNVNTRLVPKEVNLLQKLRRIEV